MPTNRTTTVYWKDIHIYIYTYIIYICLISQNNFIFEKSLIGIDSQPAISALGVAAGALSCSKIHNVSAKHGESTKMPMPMNYYSVGINPAPVDTVNIPFLPYATVLFVDAGLIPENFLL